jgi:hypothetical protein
MSQFEGVRKIFLKWACVKMSPGVTVVTATPVVVEAEVQLGTGEAILG